MAKIKTLKTQFEAADAARTQFMERARNCATLTQPTMLPRDKTTQAHSLERSYQSLGSDGLSNLVSKLLLAIFPPNLPWFRFKPSARMRSDPNVTLEMRDLFETYLYARELLIQSQLDTTKIRTKFRTAFEHTLALGNSLTLCGGEKGDYWFKNFRLDHYVQKRGSDSEVLWGITKELKDPLELSDEDIEKAGLNREELERKEGDQRNQELYTKWTRQPGGTWLIQQEINDKIIRESKEPVNPYLSLGYIELTGEDYSRGLVEEKMGDLLSFNTHSRSLLDWGTMASKVTPVMDEATSGGMKPSDLMKASGEVVIGRVINGEVQGVGFLSTKMGGEIRVVAEIAGTIERRLGKQFLLETEAQRQAERVTATEVMRVARQLEGALGAIYSEIATEVQRPLLNRIVYQMERDKLLVPIPAGLKAAVDIEILTGLEAMGRQVELEKLVSAFQMMSVSPDLMARLSPERMMAAIFRGHNLDMIQFVKTQEEMQAEAELAQQQALQAAAGEQAVKTAGAVVEERAKQQAAPAAAPSAA